MNAEAIDIALGGALGGFRLDVAFRAPMHGVTVLFGPSGCGKTSTLRGVAGLSRHRGHVHVGDAIWQDAGVFLPPHRRPIGYVFQEASLFPHLSVLQNLTYGLRRAGRDDAIRLDDTVSLLGLTGLIERGTASLSGGERQRVSIGRALLSQPQLLLMDEPLSALDRDARDEILPYLENLHRALSLPIMLVTHDLTEVERLADHLVLLRAGKVVASGPLNTLLNEVGAGLAARRDFASVLPGRVVRRDADGLTVISVAGCDVLLVADQVSIGDAVRLRLAASDISLVRSRAEDSSILNMLPATIDAMEEAGNAECRVRLLLAGRTDAPFQARISNRSAEKLSLKIGETIIAQIKGVSLLASR